MKILILYSDNWIRDIIKGYRIICEKKSADI